MAKQHSKGVNTQTNYETTVSAVYNTCVHIALPNIGAKFIDLVLIRTTQIHYLIRSRADNLAYFKH